MSACDSDTEDEEYERCQLPVDFRRWQALAQKTPVVLLHQRTRTRLERCIQKKASIIFHSTPPPSPRRRRAKRRHHRAPSRRSVHASRLAVKVAMQAASTAKTRAVKASLASRKANRKHRTYPTGPSEKFLQDVIRDGRRPRRPTHSTTPHLTSWGAGANDAARMGRLRRLAYAAKVRDQQQKKSNTHPQTTLTRSKCGLW